MDFELLTRQSPNVRAAENVHLPEAHSTVDAELVPATPSHIVNAQHLPRVDGGYKAWRYCALVFVLETLSWGFISRLVDCHYVYLVPFD